MSFFSLLNSTMTIVRERSDNNSTGGPAYDRTVLFADVPCSVQDQKQKTDEMQGKAKASVTKTHFYTNQTLDGVTIGDLIEFDGDEYFIDCPPTNMAGRNRYYYLTATLRN
jgi:hypothetical protein